jgi:hypothetical protein
MATLFAFLYRREVRCTIQRSLGVFQTYFSESIPLKPISTARVPRGLNDSCKKHGQPSISPLPIWSGKAWGLSSLHTRAASEYPT